MAGGELQAIEEKEGDAMELGDFLRYYTIILITWLANKNLLIQIRFSYLKRRLNELSLQASDEASEQLIWQQQKREEKFKKLILRSAELYAKFWDLFSEETPLYQAYQVIGYSLLKINDQICEFWKKSITANATQYVASPSILYMYATFVKLLQDDLALGIAIDEEAEISSMLNVGEMDSPVISISTQGDMLGRIQSANSALCTLSGYLKEELIGREFEPLMPEIYREYHRSAFKAFSLLPDDRQKVAGSPLKLVFIRHKSGYIIPVTVKLIGAPGYMNKYSCVAVINKDKERYGLENNVVQILTKVDGEIVGVTSNFVIYWGYSQESLYQTKVQDIFPGLTESLVENVKEIKQLKIAKKRGTSDKGQADSILEKLQKKPTASDYEISFVCLWTQVLAMADDTTNNRAMRNMHSVEAIEENISKSRKPSCGIRNFSLKVIGHCLQLSVTPLEDITSFNFGAASSSREPRPPKVSCHFDVKWNRYVMKSYKRLTRESRDTLIEDGKNITREQSISGGDVARQSSRESILEKNIAEIQTPQMEINGENGGGPFYSEVRRQLAVYQTENMQQLFALIPFKPDYSKGVITARITVDSNPSKAEFIIIENPRIPSVQNHDHTLINEMEVSKQRGRNLLEKQYDKGGEEILRSSIRNKDRFSELIRAMPTPSQFHWAISLGLFGFFVGFFCCLYLYISLTSNFTLIFNGMKLLYLQANAIKDIVVASSYMQQAYGYNAGFLRLSDEYPDYENTTEESLVKVTQSIMKDSMSSIKASIGKQSDIPFGEILNEMNSEMTYYVYFSGGFLNVSVPLEQAFLLALDTATYFAHEQDIKQYAITNPYIQEFEFNTKNAIVAPYAKTLNKFVNYIHNLADSNYNTTITMIYILFALYVLSYALSGLLISQSGKAIKQVATMCLSIQTRKYSKLKKTATEFYEAWVHGGGDSEEARQELENNADTPSQSSVSAAGRGCQRRDRNFANIATIPKILVLRLAVTIIIVTSLMLSMSLSGTNHYSNLKTIRDSYNSSARMDQIMMFIDNVYLVYTFFNTTIYEGMSIFEATPLYIRRIELLANEFHKAAPSMMSPLTDKFQDSLAHFLFRNMCAPGYIAKCSDPMASKLGFLDASIAVANGYKDIIQNYADRPKSSGGSKQYLATTSLLYSNWKEAYVNLHDKIIEATKEYNNNEDFTLLVLTICCGIIAFFSSWAIWLPEYSNKKGEVRRSISR